MEMACRPPEMENVCKQREMVLKAQKIHVNY